MLQKLRDRFFPSRVTTRPALRRFVSGEASYLAQRATYEFSRNTLAWHGQHFLGDAKFNEAFAICRWESFAAIAADMTFLVRARLAAGPGLDPPLLAVYADVLGEYPNPVHRPQGWSDCHAALLARFNATSDGRTTEVKVSVVAYSAPASRRPGPRGSHASCFKREQTIYTQSLYTRSSGSRTRH